MLDDLRQDEALEIQIVRPLVMVVAAFLFGAATFTAAAAAKGRPPGDGGERTPFEINGSVAPVYPMVDSTLVLKVENSHPFAILVTKLEVTVGDASPSCPAESLEVDPLDVPFQVPSRGDVSVPTNVRLIDGAADSCQRASFPLAYSGTATRPEHLTSASVSP